ncbi:MAG: GTP cyclohydrolase I FolE2 [Gammaproteobacteria bacterium]|nr:GTP cyclohydrolase I FolE2 [Gammaproteobacteria bacterium]|tara:strand:- start:2039 stop:2866 length:828 start_codon:yes stop_codon:yes gene_type:complete
MSTTKKNIKVITQKNNLPDTQGLIDTRNLPINKVGIKDILHPMIIKQRSGKKQSTIAKFNMYVNLPHDFKGTHMSRFVHILNNNEEQITVKSFKKMIDEMLIILEAESGHIEMSFPYFVNKTAPVSKVKSLLDYEVTFIGEIKDGLSNMKIKVLVPVTSLCPCSKKISQYGAHNQRSHVTVTATIKDFIWIEEIIDVIEKEASSELYGLLKRPDEKYVTELAYDNPKFVEDMVRDIAVHFNEDDRITEYVVESENFESIHNHSAYAQIHNVKDKV